MMQAGMTTNHPQVWSCMETLKRLPWAISQGGSTPEAA
jgi:hypothetical protein